MVRFTLTALIGLVAAGFACAEDQGAPIFGDSFDAVGTFAENWVSKNCTSADGQVRIPNGSSMHWRGALPLEFVAEADVAVARAENAPADRVQVWGGFQVEGIHFSMQPNGTTFCVWKYPGEKRSSGKYVKLEGVSAGEAVRLRLVRKTVPGGVKYVFTVNGVAAGDFLMPEPQKRIGTEGGAGYSPLSLVSYSVDMTVDNFLLATVRHDDDSPNMVFNSGCEYGEEGVPTYYGLYGYFNYAECPASDYEERYLKRFAQDSNEKHSGRYSLRVAVNNASTGIKIAPWQTGTVQGQAGVFSVWMKSSEDGLPVEISYSPKYPHGRKTVNVTTEWARYEVTSPVMGGKGVYSPVLIKPMNPCEHDAVLWIDDLQAEIVPLPEGGFDSTKTYATPYKPSELDKERFGAKPPVETPTTLVAKKLPAGVKPTVELDAWRDSAFEIKDFWMNAKPARIPTAAYLACDDDNLYIGFRNFGENPVSLTRARRPDDVVNCWNDGLELFFKPDPEQGFYHLMTTANGERFDMYANDIKWNGTWRTAARENREVGSVDILVTIPFADFAVNGFTGLWRINLGRNELSQKGNEVHASTAKHKKVDFRKPELWNFLELPPEIAAKWSGKCVRRTTAGDVVLGRLNFYMDEPDVAWRVTEPDGRTTVVMKPLKEIPMGTNIVAFVANGKTFQEQVVRLPYRKNAVQINHWARCVVKDGEKIFFAGPGLGVLGYFDYKPGLPTYKTMIDIVSGAGFKHALGLFPCRTNILPDITAVLSEIRSHGMLYANWSDFGWCRWEGFPADRKKDARIDIPPEAVVSFFRPYEDLLLTHLVIDEPELTLSGDVTRRWLEYMKAFYPHQPVQMNNTVMGIPSKFADLKTDILMLDDYLTNNEGRTVDSVVRQVDVMQDAPGGKPCWYFIVSHNSSQHYKLPTYAEQIAQSWGCICAGCSGLAWYFELPVTEGCWKAMKQVNREVQELKDVILSEELCDQATADRPKSQLRHMTRTRDGEWYVLSCNIDAKPLAKVTYALPKSATRSGTIEVLYEDRTIPFENGVFTDNYAPHTRHIYRIK